MLLLEIFGMNLDLLLDQIHIANIPRQQERVTSVGKNIKKWIHVTEITRNTQLQSVHYRSTILAEECTGETIMISTDESPFLLFRLHARQFRSSTLLWAMMKAPENTKFSDNLSTTNLLHCYHNSLLSPAAWTKRDPIQNYYLVMLHAYNFST